MQELIILMGLQGAGKSSFYRKYFSQTHEIVSKDLMKNKKHKSLHQEKLVRKYFSEGRSVIVDNMNLTAKNRQDLITMAKDYGEKVILYYFPLEISESLIRNKGENRKEVPTVAIYASNKTFELPSKNEGFDECFEVEMINPHSFNIRPYHFNED